MKNNDEFLQFEDEPMDFEDEIMTFNEENVLTWTDDNYWHILVVDDDDGVHQVTKLVLNDFEFQGKPIKLHSAYTEDEARRIMSEKKISLVLLDVVMDKEDSGLRLIKYIREQLENRLTRIILRTGQPGQAPERQVILNYDINDYKLKTELTADKLFVAVVSALRSFGDLSELEENGKSLERVIDSSLSIFRERRITEFAGGIMKQLVNLLSYGLKIDENTIYGFTATYKNERYIINSGHGRYRALVDQTMIDVVDTSIIEMIQHAEITGENQYNACEMVIVFESDDKQKNLVYIKSTHDISNWDKNLIEIFSTNISVAYNNLYLSNEVEATQKEIIYRLGEVAEARSRETGHHVKRVSEYSRLMAIKLGLSETESDILAMASPVHDIGKLAIPDNILNKPGGLSEDEFEIMKKHAKYGYDILKNSNREILKAASVIAVTHHEWWNGNGYPRGLIGEEIHVYGRIVALADVFDALGSDRVYKKAWPLERIVAYIDKEKGRHFDPTLVELFLDNLDEFLEIRSRLSDH